MSAFFNSNVNANEEQLNKALTAGYGTDSSMYNGGRALIPEDCESETLNVVEALKEDCKVMSSLKKTAVKSTVHEKNVRTSFGDWEFGGAVGEGETPSETSQSISRKAYNMKYLVTTRGITKQMEMAKSFEDAYASEKIAGIETIIKMAEHQCFNGDSSIIPAQFDGFVAQIKKADANDKNILSLRGNAISTVGESVFDEIASTVYAKGGDLSQAYYPSVLAKDIKDLFADKQRYIMNNALENLSFNAIPNYSTAVGSTIRLSGSSAGADKFFKVKGKVVATGDALKRPSAPSAVKLSVESDANSQFTADDAGDYKYTVHAINGYGISEGFEAGNIAVGSGARVVVTISAGMGVEATGYIICRSKKDGSEVMEMDRVAAISGSDTVYYDLNTELPGTASMLLLTENKIQPIYEFAQLMPVSTMPLPMTAAMVLPFNVAMFGALEVNAPKYCALVKDIAYKGGLY